MRNDTERQEFVLNPENWHRAGEPIMGNIRVMELEYKGHFWYRVEMFRKGERAIRTPDFSLRYEPVTEWESIKMYVLEEESGAIKDTVCTSQIVNEIKEIDKKERKDRRK